ncbi:MAG TPA: RodZ domain-containing protein [Spongiibacteraceae bacterium]
MSNHAAATPGLLLRQARERSGLTREAVAKELNLRLSQIVALEEGEFKHFPGETFVKGYLRSYARLLKINPDEVLRIHAGTATASMPQKQQASMHVQWRPVSLETKVGHWRRYSGVAATMLVLLALWAWQQHRDKAQPLSLTADVSGAHELPGGIDSALNSGAESALLDSVQLLPNSPAKTATPAAAQSGDGNVAATGNADQLSLRFSADCWIEIKDRDNKLIVATLKHADEKLQIEGRGPFKVLLGYAPGVVMAYNGIPVKVDVAEGSRSTRLIVGSS